MRYIIYLGIKYKTPKRDLTFPGLSLEENNEEEREVLKTTLTERYHRIAINFNEVLPNFYIFLKNKPENIFNSIQVVIIKRELRCPTIYMSNRATSVEECSLEQKFLELTNVLDQYIYYIC